ncbi:tRNA lysidine(34) synthetase TilS [Rhodopila sp.]|uniref:tRNA lysidine(34) synthetase TilS n=1 Tax=Rhodopila sp. TaxID=2480087 RepID=UPI003D0F6058
MERLGPFEPCPALAVAASGGADSMALAILAADWARARDGSALALVVDHGLRPASAEEARITVERLAGLGIEARTLRLAGLTHGSALAERARIGRYQSLTEACRGAGVLHLLLGHHQADQAETVMMRVLRGSGTHGLAGMAALREIAGVRLLRPLLGIEPAVLRGFLAGRGVSWIEDPSNQDTRATRPRLRHRLAGERLAASGPDASGPSGSGPSGCDLAGAIAAVGAMRAREEAEAGAELAACAMIRPEGFALLRPGRIGPAALAGLLQAIGGAGYAASADQVAELAAEPRPATVAGVRIMPAGRFGDGLLIVREEQAVMQAVAVAGETTWDRRFRVSVTGQPPQATVGKLGADAARFRRLSDLPSAVLRTLPAVRVGNSLVAVPHLRYAIDGHGAGMNIWFAPARPVAGAAFVPAPAYARAGVAC